MRLSSSSPSPRQRSSRRSSLKFNNGHIPLNQLVDDWQFEHHKSNRPQTEHLKSLFKSSVELQETSKNLVFYDRGLREVKEFPYPLSKYGDAIVPGGFYEYFKNRRLRFECFCGLTESVEQYVDAQKGPFGYYVACTHCDLYVSLNKVRSTATSYAIYPHGDAYGEVKSATLSTQRILERSQQSQTRRSKRRITAPLYSRHRGRHTKSLMFERSMSPPSASELLKSHELPPKLDHKGKGKARPAKNPTIAKRFSSPPSTMQGTLSADDLFGSSSKGPSSTESTSNARHFEFCKCGYGIMLEEMEYHLEHECSILSSD